jgi:hypothetical protein
MICMAAPALCRCGGFTRGVLGFSMFRPQVAVRLASGGKGNFEHAALRKSCEFGSHA